MTVEETKQELWWEQREEFMGAYYDKVFWYRLSQLEELYMAYPWLGTKD